MSRSNLQPVDKLGQGPLRAISEGSAPRYDATIRDNVAVTYRKLERAAPRAADRLAEGFTALHESMSGRCSSTCGYHSPDMFRRIVRGEDSMNIGELYRMAAEGQTEEVMGFLAPLLDMCNRDVVKRPMRGPTLSAAAADVSVTAGRLLAAVIRAAGDGMLDRDEERQLATGLEDLEKGVSDAKAALGRGRSNG